MNPDGETYVVNTSNWCDPAKQAEAAKSLLAQGVDVITQHQDCTATVIKAAEAAGAMVVGYHADASSLAPEGLDHRLGVGLGRPLHRHREDGGRRRVHRPQVQRQLPGRLQGRRQPVRAVGVRADRSTDETKALIAEAAEATISTDAARRSPGPVDRPGRHACCSRTATSRTTPTIEAHTPSSSKGVVGDIPKS